MPKMSSWRATQRRDEVAIARPGDDPLVLPHRERMRPGGADRQPAARGRLAHLAAQRTQLLPGRDGRRARFGGDLEHGLHELGFDLAGLALDVGSARVLQERFDRVYQRVALRVDDHHLLLDPDGEAGAVEVLTHRAGAYPPTAIRSGAALVGATLLKQTLSRTEGMTPWRP
jgi:hypothetical protein